MTETIVILDPLPPERAERLRSLLPTGLELRHATARGDDHLKAIIAEAHYAISGQVAVSGDLLRAAPRLKLLHKWGVGTDNLDVAAALELGIVVARTTGSNAVPVAEFTMGLILAATRGIAYAHAELKAGEWRGGRMPFETFMLSGKTVGIVGFGAIGRAIARLLGGFACEVLYTKRARLPFDEETALGVAYASLPDLLARSDIVTLNCPLTTETAGLMDAAALRTMKRSAILVNVARGGVVVEADLVDALRSGVIRGAAFDVFETEPLPSSSPLLSLDNLVVTPHLAAVAADNFARTVGQMFGNIARVARGEAIPQNDLVLL